MSFKCATNCANRPRFYFIKVFWLVGSLRYLPLHFSILNRKTESLPIAHDFTLLRFFGLLVACATFPSIFRYSIEKRSPCQSPALFYLVARIKRVCCRFTLCSQSAKLSKKLYYVTSFVFRFAFLVSFI